MIIGLTVAQYEAAREIGRMRQSLREARGNSPAQYQDGGGTHLDRHALGAVAEYALAVHFDVLDKWKEEQAYSEEHWKIPCDVGRNLHVRATSHPKGGMILHPYDPADGVFVLAVVNGPDVTFMGWLYGKEAKQPQYWRNTGPGFGRRPAFLVPQRDLSAFYTIPREAVS